MQIIITESQYKILLQEQKVSCCLELKSKKEMVKGLFDMCEKLKGSDNDKLINITKEIFKSIQGLGTSNNIKMLFSQISTMEDLAKVIHTYPFLVKGSAPYMTPQINYYGNGESLFEALSGEMLLPWSEILIALMPLVRESKIQWCKTKDPKCL